ncbi:carbon-nitrogen family hydrolase [uncultured Mailhella sp.]|uniref:carbon-nitrogen family hydrolase n=1 Tax=uncultured Mailhella sp. TaxID=1981031 RepID=UPI002615C4A0|nr:carbon-nitrogen family hydrolase [uncultured Mailhella sp.]
MRVSVLQMDVVKGDREANHATIRRMVAEAMQASPRPEVLVLPELWSTGYALSEKGALASPGGRTDAAFLGELAREHHVSFIGGSVLSLNSDGQVTNRAQIIDSEGRYAAGYDKIHLFRLMEEDRYLARGRKPLLFRTPDFLCGLIICYDLRFCELVRKLAVEGAEVLFLSAEWPLARREHWEILLRARAIENQMYVVACNRCGVTEGEEFGGTSLIIAPDGAVLQRAGREEAILHAELDPALVRRTRERIQIFRDRVPEVY